MITDLPRQHKVAILLPVYNALTYTKKTLENLSWLLVSDTLALKGFVFEIVVVDDGSTDGTSEWIKAHFPGVHVLAGDGNLWWSGGINRAAVFAMSEQKAHYLLLWNNDIVAGEEYFPALCRILTETGPETIVGSKVFIAGTDDIIWTMGGRFNPVRVSNTPWDMESPIVSPTGNPGG
jgi:GT2 family glycosyltransferase